MTKGILGRKVGMTQIFDENGACLPVTVVLAGPCRVLQVRTAERDGYEAVQLGFLDKPRRLASRSESGHVADIGSRRSKRLKAAGVQVEAKANCEPQRFVRELRGAPGALAVGGTVDVGSLDGVKAVDVTGFTKGRGFTGAMKRWNFAGQRATHGVKKVHRHMGGTGALAANRGGGRMKKGKKMPGRYGNEQVTIRNMRLVKLDKEKNLLLINGAVPGPPGTYLIIRETNKVG
ncbi:50S ribosomal protein L3 [Anatilimnocola aggregata]|uniref:Large ribosomal subunit protein uL3 n=1 Tax=Anatilimnocola aggregata TaxID=2528021 RepID=A0A517YJT4_9BACT|nr:50S ribosomal protein L3 [Anatilimnocola aggregata]QDU30476.1 50S ribosomal protein L3 [Anatilimnocola aggregata]